jgi:SH3-like domain-containing protein
MGEAAGPSQRSRTLARTACLALLLTIAWKTGAGAASAPAPLAHPTPSGLPVPRYVSLKFGEVNARAGPGDDYKALWTYRTRGLPLQVIAETAEWRRVCDPEGAVAWVHQRTLDQRRTVMRVQTEPLAMLRRPDPKSPPAAVLAGRSLASLGACKADWCQVSVGRAKGWAPVAELWGIAGGAQCRAPIAKAAP